MGLPLLVLLSLAIAFQNIIDVSAAPSGTNTGTEGTHAPVKSPYFDISVNLESSNNKNIQTVVLSGNGVYDTFKLTSDSNVGIGTALTSIATDKFALYENRDHDFSFFTDSDSTLVVFKSDKCTKRSYKTSGTKTTYTELKMSPSECTEVKSKMKESREKWQREFEEDMKKKFPPCFPNCGSIIPAKGVDGAPGGIDGTPGSKGADGIGYAGADGDDGKPSEEESESSKEDTSETSESSSNKITATDITSPEYWRQWQQKFQADLQKRFPPCYPFCDQKNKSGSSSSKKEGGNDKRKDTKSLKLTEKTKGSAKKNDSDDEDIDEWNF